MIVTGASSGIGRALAFAAVRAGYRVMLVARRQERLEQVAAEIGSAGGECAYLVADVTDANSPSRIVDATRKAFGRIDVVVNNAGVGAPGTLLEQSDDAIEYQWQLHVAAPLRISRAALRDVRATHGQLVFVGSGLARVPAPGFGAYCAAKAAVRAAAIQMRRELAKDGVAVTYVDPGAVDTEFSHASGMQRAEENGGMAVAPERVARTILRGIERRARRINATPWQTAAVVIGEWFPGVADAAMKRIVDSPAAAPAPSVPARRTTPALRRAASTPVEETPASLDAFDAALAPVARRMERVKLPPAFLRETLVPFNEIELGDLAMRWAGMPNKNERAVLREALDALAGAGYLAASGSETWRVLRAAD
jgi:short-subunit dehydrogenase